VLSFVLFDVSLMLDFCFLILKFILCKNKRFQQSKSFSTVALSSYPAKRELGDVLEK